MASGRKGNRSARKLHQMTADYGMRAAMALNDYLPGQHRDKIVARMFGVSLRMAKYLRKGHYWTLDRLSQASAELGAGFDLALAGKRPEIGEIVERLARLEERFDAQLVNNAGQELAHEQGQSILAAGGEGAVGHTAAENSEGAGERSSAVRRALENEAPLAAERASDRASP